MVVRTAADSHTYLFLSFKTCTTRQPTNLHNLLQTHLFAIKIENLHEFIQSNEVVSIC